MTAFITNQQSTLDWLYWFYPGGVLQDGHQPLLDASDQLQARVEVFLLQQTDAGGQVSALQQCFL